LGTPWQIPEILEDEIVGDEAKRLYADARSMLDTISSENWLEHKAVYGLFEANSDQDDIELYDENGDILHVVRTMRQQTKKAKGVENIALADFVVPKTTGVKDHLGAFVVTSGIGIEEHIERF
jgi:5-methyltetrahydrofolate--homocysteine methyltransferase